MIEESTQLLTAKYRTLVKEHLCSECGNAMAVADRVEENGFLYVWYECTRPGCNGQWLERKPC